jgi:hypothetical protein
MNIVSLGFFFFKISFNLRDSMLLNGILTNAEVWNQVESKHIDILESIDLMLIKKILNAHCMTAKEAFFLEAGIMPIKFILSKRRLFYLWNILNRNDNELLKRFYHTQKLFRSKIDWVELVEQDKEDFGIDISDDEILKMKEGKFKSLVNKSVIQKSLDHLNTVADGHLKSKNLVKPKMVREPYFDDSRFSRSDIELLFSLRTRMLDLKGNFSNKYGLVVACRVSKVHVECQEHILKC